MPHLLFLLVRYEKNLQNNIKHVDTSMCCECRSRNSLCTTKRNV